jgi:outer membrane protein OmpA-like peptidoglycan-associated protein
MTEEPNMVLEVLGHTDALGTPDYNMQLGERRAEAARRYLRDTYDLPVNRFESVSYGELKARSLSGSELRIGNHEDRKVQLNLWQQATYEPEPQQQPQAEEIS